MPLTNPQSMSAANLASDTTFQNRVKLRLYVACQNVYSNNGSNVAPDGVLFYTRRKSFAIQILQSVSSNSTTNWSVIFAEGAASDATVLSDATVGLTVDVVPTNSLTQQALVTDLHIDNAISSQFNSFLAAQ